MVDLETLGLTRDTPIIQFTALAFDIGTGEILDKFHHNVQMQKAQPINPETLIWWLETDKDLLYQILKKGELGLPEKKILDLFITWIAEFNMRTQKVYLWGNGILFDNKLIQQKMEDYGLKYPIYYRNDRDVRTLVDLYITKNGGTYEQLKADKPEGLVEHDSHDDCVAQIYMVSKCFNDLIINKGENDEKII